MREEHVPDGFTVKRIVNHKDGSAGEKPVPLSHLPARLCSSSNRVENNNVAAISNDLGATFLTSERYLAAVRRDLSKGVDYGPPYTDR